MNKSIDQILSFYYLNLIYAYYFLNYIENLVKIISKYLNLVLIFIQLFSSSVLTPYWKNKNK